MESENSWRRLNSGAFPAEGDWEHAFYLHGAGAGQSGQSSGRSGPGIRDLLSSRNIRLEHLQDGSTVRGKVLHLGTVSLVYVLAPPCEAVFDRDYELGTRGVLVLADRGRLRARGCDIALRAPNLVLVRPGADQLTLTLTLDEPESEFVYISFPASISAGIPLPSGPTRAIDTVIEPQLMRPLFRLLVSLTLKSVDDVVESSLRFSVAEAIRAVVHLAMQHTEAGASLHSRARNAIALDLGNPLLNTGTLAQRLGVSPRRLQDEFSRHGTTVQREVRRARAEALAHARNEDPTAELLELGRAFGFTSRSSVYRALREVEEPQAGV